MKRKVLLSTLFLILHFTVALAQQVTISGQVLDEKSEPLILSLIHIFACMKTEDMAKTLAVVTTERTRIANLRCKDVVAIGQMCIRDSLRSTRANR